MKTSVLFTSLFVLITGFAFGQDSTTYNYPDSLIRHSNSKITFWKSSPPGSIDSSKSKIGKRSKVTYSLKKPMYRPTRLGSSSPLYNTYRKNDNGAGAITTNPNKSAGSAPPPVIIYTEKADSTIKH